MVHVCNPRNLEAEERELLWIQGQLAVLNDLQERNLLQNLGRRTKQRNNLCPITQIQ